MPTGQRWRQPGHSSRYDALVPCLNRQALCTCMHGGALSAVCMQCNHLAVWPNRL